MENTKVFKSEYIIRFKDCDAAGIVFYPRYFEMAVVSTEEWFEQSLNLDFNKMHHKERMGIPCFHLDCNFKSPSVLGEKITKVLKIISLGKSSAQLDITFLGKNDAIKLHLLKTVVCMNLDLKKSMPWPSVIKKAMSQYCVKNN